MSFYQTVLHYCNQNRLPLHMPGHKRNPAFSMDDPYSIDLTEVDLFTSLYEETGPLRDLSKRVTRLYHTKQSFLLVNGSTGGILTAICACTRPGDTILINRNAHISVYHAASIFHLHLKYISHENALTGLTAANVSSCLSGEGRISLIVITSPTYEGILADVKGIADVAHAYGCPLLVDEAHGAHLDFHPAFPGGALRAGADLVVQSLHKTLPALTQTALLHVNPQTNNTLCNQVRTNWSMLQTTSPSYILLNSIDQCISFLENNAFDRFEQLSVQLNSFYNTVGQMKLLKAVSLPPQQKDASKLLILTPHGYSGKQLARDLVKTYGIELELAGPSFILGISGIGDTPETLLRFAAALTEMDSALFQQKSGMQISAEQLHELPSTLPEQYLQPCLAERISESDIELLPLFLSSNRVSLDFIYLYPPGTPLIVPGEIISEPMIEYFKYVTSSGFSLSGMTDCSGKSLRVLCKKDCILAQ